MMTIPPRLKGALVWLPLLGYLGAIGLAEAQRSGAPHYELPIEGYDPRDLVRGHYLLYRFVASRVSASPDDLAKDPTELACISNKSATKRGVVIYPAESERPPNCELDIPLDFAEEAHRFYVQEDKAQKLEALVREKRASVVVIVPKSGVPTPSELLIDGKKSFEVKLD